MENTFTADLTNCDREPIHIPGAVQPHGFLLALAPGTLIIEKASLNTKEFLDKDAQSLIGQQLTALEQHIIPVKAGSSLMELVRLATITSNLEQINPQPVLVNGREMLFVIHQYLDHIICEFEPMQSNYDTITLQKIMTTALSVIQSSASFQELLQHVSTLVKEITGYNRIMVYKFHKDQHGEVIAEAKDEELESWLHLHYPASDIPSQARELYKLNLVRIIADVNARPSGLISSPDRTAPLDLTHSVLRAVSPIHIEYLKNMQVGASFSISLISKGELWGLIACHNSTARFIDYNSRVACKFIGQLFSAALEFKHSEEFEEKNNIYRDKQQQLLEQLMKSDDPVKSLVGNETNLLDINSATGVVFFYEGKQHCLGTVPSEEEVDELIGWLKKHAEGTFFQTSSLPLQLPAAKKIASIASGVMATEISHDFSEYIVWFKPEIIKTVDWAGQQQKDTTIAEDGSIRISPRKSFATWTQEVKFSSDEWTNNEIAAAIKLREDLIQVINKKAGEIRKLNELLKEAYDELDTFSFTISHDLRTPLSSIKNYTEIIMEDHGKDISEEARLLFTKVISAADKMAGLIRDVLQYSRVGRAEVSSDPIDMGRILKEIKEELISSRKEKNPVLEIKNTPDVYGDKTMILQLLTNLIGNAVKYSTLPNQISRVSVNGQVKDGFVTYTIEDNGIGIDMRFANRIFELFKRMDNAKKIEGTGVGLAIAKRIVEKHEGKIWLESQLNHGTKFYVSLPVK
ncbi:MAG: histidine kinase [Citrobacter freundii]|nr:MAG: histidine kinase [Citrobacter freundii]